MEAIQLDRKGDVAISFGKINGNSVNIMGLKRSGKSNSGGVFLEGWLDAGYPLTFVDPHNEGWGLKFFSTLEPSPYPILVAGRGQRADIPLNVEHAADLAEFSYTHRISVVLSLFRIEESERFAILKAYFERLWQLAEQAYDAEDIHTYGVALEEAPTYLPQVGTTPVKAIMKKIVQEGGKFGFTTFLITQRSQDIDKSILGQGSIYVLHKVLHPRDKEVYKGIVPEPGERVEQKIAQLQTGDAILVDEGKVQIVHVQPQKTFHVGATPGAKQQKAPAISLLDTAMLEQLRAMMTHALPEDPAQQQLKSLQQQVQGLLSQQIQSEQEYERTLATKDEAIRDLQTQLDIVRKISLIIEGKQDNTGSEQAPSTLHLDQLHTNVEHATIDVTHLRTMRHQSTALEEATPSVSSSAFLSQVQQLVADNRRLQTDLEQLRESQPVPASPHDVVETLSNQEIWNWRGLVADLSSIGETERKIVKQLFAYDGRGMAASEIAGQLHMAADTIRRNIPATLIERKIIRLSKQGNTTIYTARVQDYLSTTFPKKEKAILAHVHALL